MGDEPPVKFDYCRDDEGNVTGFRVTISPHADDELHARQEADSKAFDEYVSRMMEHLPCVPEGYYPVFKNIPCEYSERWEYVRQNPFRTLSSANVVIAGQGKILTNEIAVEYVRVLGGIPSFGITRKTDIVVNLWGSCEGRDFSDYKRRHDEGSSIIMIDEERYLQMINDSISENAGTCSDDYFIPKPNFFVSLDARYTPFEYVSVVKSDEEIWQDVVKRYEREEQPWRERKTWQGHATIRQLGFLESKGILVDDDMTFAAASEKISNVILKERFEEEKQHNESLKSMSSEERMLWYIRHNRWLDKHSKKKEKRVADMERRQAKEKAKEQKVQNQAEHIRLRDVYKERRKLATKEVLHRWREEFALLWNQILADGIVEPDEVEQMRNWLKDHMRKFKDFEAAFKVIDMVLSDGVVTPEESKQLYAAAVECLKDLGSTHYDGVDEEEE